MIKLLITVASFYKRKPLSFFVSKGRQIADFNKNQLSAIPLSICFALIIPLFYF
jgi:hypothetical protein